MHIRNLKDLNKILRSWTPMDSKLFGSLDTFPSWAKLLPWICPLLCLPELKSTGTPKTTQLPVTLIGLLPPFWSIVCVKYCRTWHLQNTQSIGSRPLVLVRSVVKKKTEKITGSCKESLPLRIPSKCCQDVCFIPSYLAASHGANSACTCSDPRSLTLEV